jgi:hypothetical protein
MPSEDFPAAAAAGQGTPSPSKRGRGRPKGGFNKPKEGELLAAQQLLEIHHEVASAGQSEGQQEEGVQGQQEVQEEAAPSGAPEQEAPGAQEQQQQGQQNPSLAVHLLVAQPVGEHSHAEQPVVDADAAPAGEPSGAPGRQPAQLQPLLGGGWDNGDLGLPQQAAAGAAGTDVAMLTAEEVAAAMPEEVVPYLAI